MADYFNVLNETPNSRKNTSISDYIVLENDKSIKLQLIIPPAIGKVFTHWIPTDGKKMPIRCLGDDCPICRRNETTGYDNKNPEFIQRSISYIANVVDLTPSKVCPKCETINERNATVCTGKDCEEKLINVEAQPMKALRYLEGNKTLFRQLEETSEMLAEAGYQISAVPLALKKVNNPDNKPVYPTIPQIGDKEAVDPKDYEDNLFDYQKVGIHVSYEEMVLLMNGGSFREMLQGRSKKTEEKKDRLDAMFANLE